MKSDPILSYLEKMHSLAPVSCKSVYKAMVKSHKLVNCVSLRAVFSPKEIELIKDVVSPKSKQCYKNASALCHLFPDRVEYCEGFILVEGLPIEHAFNKVGDLFIDITEELAINKNPNTYPHSIIGIYSSSQVYDSCLSSGVYGGVFLHFNK